MKQSARTGQAVVTAVKIPEDWLQQPDLPLLRLRASQAPTSGIAHNPTRDDLQVIRIEVSWKAFYSQALTYCP